MSNSFSTLTVLSNNIRRTGAAPVRNVKPSKHASMWNAMAARRAELNPSKVTK